MALQWPDLHGYCRAPALLTINRPEVLLDLIQYAGVIMVYTIQQGREPTVSKPMTFQNIAEALASTASDEDLAVSNCNGNIAIQKGSQSMGLIACGDHALSFYFKSKSSPGLLIETKTNKDEAFSRGLDFIYS